jgi:hypothetical protein
MPHKLSGAARVATIAGYQGRGGQRHGGPPPEHVLLTHRAVGPFCQRLGVPRTFLVADPDMALPCWSAQWPCACSVRHNSCPMLRQHRGGPACRLDESAQGQE